MRFTAAPVTTPVEADTKELRRLWAASTVAESSYLHGCVSDSADPGQPTPGFHIYTPRPHRPSDGPGSRAGTGEIGDLNTNTPTLQHPPPLPPSSPLPAVVTVVYQAKHRLVIRSHRPHLSPGLAVTQ